MSETIFSIEGKPVPASRPRVFRNGGVSYPKAHWDYEKYLKSVLPVNRGETFTGPVEVRMLFVMPPYKTSDYPTHRADVDNLSKLPMDVMTKAEFWTDDSLIVSLTALKRFCRKDETPHTKVRIIPLDKSTTTEDRVDHLFFN